MEHIAVLTIIGLSVLISFLGGKIVNRFRLPMVIGYVMMGVIFGKSFLNILNPEIVNKVGLINDIALGIIAFIIGAELNWSRIKTLGKTIIIIAIFESIGAFTLVTFFTYLLTKKIYIALILGSVSSATAPAATVAVINQYKAKGPLTTTILGIVGSDDAIALIIYAFASSLALAFLSHKSISYINLLIVPVKDVLLSIFLGGLIGILLGYFISKLSSRSSRFTIIIGTILLGEGLATQLGVSELLLVMSIAIAAVNFFPKRIIPLLDSINLAGFPIIAAFFFLAGTRLDIKLLSQIGILGIIYLIARMAGKYLGANFGARIAKAPDVIKKYVGLSLWPQIGVAVALAIVIERQFSPLGKEGSQLALIAMNILLFTTILTETIGPIATRFSLKKAGEINPLREAQ
jgi:Kef-type K+ transport system membrane component KefB